MMPVECVGCGALLEGVQIYGPIDLPMCWEDYKDYVDQWWWSFGQWWHKPYGLR